MHCQQTPASRPALEVADIVHACGKDFSRKHRLSIPQQRVLRAIGDCRTAKLGGHIATCDQCGTISTSYNSCGNRHCPKCQSLAKQRWVEKQCADLLTVPYFHIVFTLPHALNPIAQGNPQQIYTLLFRAASETLLEFGRNPRWLGGEIGFTMVLHTWSQNLGQHIHAHCIVTAGALNSDGDRWIRASPGFLFPVRALSRVFRTKYLQSLNDAYQAQSLHFAGSVSDLVNPCAFSAFITALYATDWVVYAKKPFADAANVLAYLGRYTHRIGIANHRLVSFDGNHVRFRWRDYAHGNKNKIMTLTADEFLRRFLLHTLPRQFCRIRHYGIVGNRCRHRKLALCRALLDQPDPVAPAERETTEAMMRRVVGVDIHQCKHCQQGRLRLAALLQPLLSYTLNPRATGPP